MEENQSTKIGKQLKLATKLRRTAKIGGGAPSITKAKASTFVISQSITTSGNSHPMKDTGTLTKNNS